MKARKYVMSTFIENKNRVSLLARAEYRYHRLAIEFSDNYLELKRAEYSPLPDIVTLKSWLSHLHNEIRPSLFKAQALLASHFGFQLGDRIKVNQMELYVFRISCYPLENIVRLEGYNVKKDGKPGQTVTFIEVQENEKVEKLNGALKEVESLIFSEVTRSENIKCFISEVSSGVY